MSGETTSRIDRPPSVSSSSAETATHEDNEKLARLDPSGPGLEELKGPEDMDVGDGHEHDGLLPPQDEKPEPPKSTFTTALIWMVVNTLATVGIVGLP